MNTPMNLGRMLRRRMNKLMGRPMYDCESYVDKLETFFRRKGWKRVSQELPGLFTVSLFRSPCGQKIAKVSRIGGDFYPEYIKWVATHSGEHFPKIYSARSMFRGTLFVVIMEKLEHLPLDFSSVLWTHNIKYPDSVGYLKHINRNGADLQALAALGMGSIVRDLTKLFTSLGHFTDNHVGNMMLRGNTLVFADPYYHAPQFRGIGSQHNWIS